VFYSFTDLLEYSEFVLTLLLILRVELQPSRNSALIQELCNVYAVFYTE